MTLPPTKANLDAVENKLKELIALMPPPGTLSEKEMDALFYDVVLGAMTPDEYGLALIVIQVR